MVSPLAPYAHAISASTPGIVGSTPDSTPSVGGENTMTPTTDNINTSYNSVVPHSSEANTSSMTLGVVVKSIS